MRFFKMNPVLYPDLYCWYVLAASLDIIITTIVMDFFGFIEVNGFAAAIIDRYGFVGLVPFKFATVILVLLICEYVGRLRQEAGLRVAQIAVVLSSMPVIAAAGQFMLFQPAPVF